MKTYRMTYLDSAKGAHQPYYDLYGGDDKIFQANYNSSTESYNSLVGAEITTTEIMIYPLTYESAPAMRVEVYACVYGCKVREGSNVLMTSYCEFSSLSSAGSASHLWRDAQRRRRHALSFLLT